MTNEFIEIWRDIATIRQAFHYHYSNVRLFIFYCPLARTPQSLYAHRLVFFFSRTHIQTRADPPKCNRPYRLRQQRKAQLQMDLDDVLSPESRTGTDVRNLT